MVLYRRATRAADTPCVKITMSGPHRADSQVFFILNFAPSLKQFVIRPGGGGTWRRDNKSGFSFEHWAMNEQEKVFLFLLFVLSVFPIEHASLLVLSLF